MTYFLKNFMYICHHEQTLFEMMKFRAKLLSVALLLLATLYTNAQVTPQNGQAWWGMWNSDMGLTPVGSFAQGDNTCAIRLLAYNQTELKDCQVHGLRFYISDKTKVTAAKVWLSVKTFKNDAADVCIKEIPVSQLRDQLHDGAPTEVLFDEPYTPLPSSNRYASVYAGFTLTMAEDNACDMLASGKRDDVKDNSNIYGWTTNLEKSYGALAMQLLVSGGTLKPVAIDVANLGEMVVMKGTAETALEATLTNWGTKPFSNIDYVVRTGTGKDAEKRLNLEKPINELGLTRKVLIPLSVPAEARLYKYELEITKADGQANQSDSKKADGELIVLQKKALKRAVMEEFTGSWCPNCVRGIKGMHMLEEQFGDRFIGIAVHTGSTGEDPMILREYANSDIKKRAAATGVPSASIDRLIDCDPYLGDNIYQKHFTTGLLVEQSLQQMATADMEVSARWKDAEEKTVEIDVATTFGYSADDSPYKLILVMTANGLKGEGDGWLQVNGLYGKEDEGYDDDLSEYVFGPRRINMEYNHVAIAVAGINKGLEGSITVPLKCGEAQHYVYDMNLDSNALVQDKNKLYAVAMLLDTRTGTIANAAKANVLRYGTNGIETIKDERLKMKDSPVYDLQGRRVQSSMLNAQSSKLPKGIYLMNGKKVAIK